MTAMPYKYENDTKWWLPYKSLNICACTIVDYGQGYYVYEGQSSIALFKSLNEAKTFIDIYLDMPKVAVGTDTSVTIDTRRVGDYIACDCGYEMPMTVDYTERDYCPKCRREITWIVA